MNSPLPPDPYKTLGVAKDAKLPEIRSAHRKLVLKCHPDKVQDAALKAVKQDEFQKVQQAYEILSDDTKRQQYDNEARLYELRKEMGRGNPTPRSNPFEYEVKTAEPRANSFARAAPKVYTHPTSVPRSYEDLYEEPIRHTPKKSSSYESATDRDRKRTGREDARMRDDKIRDLLEEERRQERLREDRMRDDRLRDERIREERIRAEKLREKDRRDRTHGEKKKSRDKDRKTRTRQPFYEDDSSDDEAYRAAKAAKKEEKRRLEEELRLQQEQAMRARAAVEAARADAAARIAAAAAQRAQIKEAPMTPKWTDHKEYAGAYMLAARRKAVPEPEDDRHSHPTPPGLRRAETFNAQSQYQVHYATQQQYSDDDTPRRSSGHKESRRASDTPSSKREKSRRRSPEHPQNPYIVEPASPSLPPKKPTLKTFPSEPPLQSRKEPSRARTQDYPRSDPIPPPPMPRAHTFNVGDTGRGRDRGSSKPKYASAESDSDAGHSPRFSQSPRRMAPEPTVYRVQDLRAHPVPPRSHRSDLHSLNEGYPHEPSAAPHGTPHRPVLTRSPPSGDYHASSSYYPVPEPPPTKPFVVTARPKLPREGSGRSHSHQTVPNAAYNSVKYAPTYDQSQVKYADYPNFYESKRPSDHYPSRRGQEVYT